MTLRYLSVCSGIEAASVAWSPLGWQAVAFSEIEPFACALLAHHYPDVPNWGDMIRFQEWPDDANVDVLCGGTPCQSFSVAGRRGGLDDPRGDLMRTYIAIAARYRPRWLVWENVPGVLSSGGGRDFGTLLGGLADIGYGFAYRVLDAQYFGLAQRRRRVFVVGCAGNWHAAAAVLFERASLSGHPAPRREAGQNLAPTLAARTRGGGGLGTDFDCDGGLIAGTVSAKWAKGTGGPSGDECQNLIAVHGTKDPDTLVDLAHTLGRNHGQENAISHGEAVRRLTPLECERLMGFPDGYTAISYHGRLAADRPRYYALGNSWGVPVARWVGRRIAAVDGVLNVNQAHFAGISKMVGVAA